MAVEVWTSLVGLGGVGLGTAVKVRSGEVRFGEVGSGSAWRLRFGEAGVAVRCGLVWHGGYGTAVEAWSVRIWRVLVWFGG